MGESIGCMQYLAEQSIWSSQQLTNLLATAGARVFLDAAKCFRQEHNVEWADALFMSGLCCGSTGWAAEVSNYLSSDKFILATH